MLERIVLHDLIVKLKRANATELQETIARLKEEHAKDLQEQAAKQAKGYEELLRQRFGFQARKIKAELHLENLEGDCVFYRSYHQVSVSNIILPHILHRVVVSEEGSVEGAPFLLNPNFHKDLSLSVNEAGRKPNELSFRLVIQGNLTKDDDPLTYEYSVKVKKGFAMDEEAFYRRTPSREHGEPDGEYFAFDVEYPVEELELIVRFPENYRVKPHVLAFLGHGWIAHYAEHKRIRTHFEYEANQAKILITNPLHGFRYIILWKPLKNSQNGKEIACST